MARIRAELPPGRAREMALGGVKSGLLSLYHEVKQDDSSFSRDLVSRVSGYNVNDAELGVQGTLADIAKQNGLEKEFNAYLKKDVLGGMKGKLAYLLDLTTSIKDGLEDIVGGAEMAATVAAAVPTLGAGGIAVQVGSKVIKVPLQVATQIAYSGIAGLLGYASGTYQLNRQGTKNYFSDIGKGFLGTLGGNIPILGNFIELGTNLDDKRPRIAEAASKRTEAWLLNKIREKKGLATVDYVEDDLESIARKGTGKVSGAVKVIKSKVPKLINYNTASGTPIYGADVAESGYSRAA